MEYEINVSKWNDRRKLYEYYFRVSTTYGKLKIVYDQLKENFPEPQYKLNATMWEKIGRDVDVENF